MLIATVENIFSVNLINFYNILSKTLKLTKDVHNTAQAKKMVCTKLVLNSKSQVKTYKIKQPRQFKKYKFHTLNLNIITLFSIRNCKIKKVNENGVRTKEF